MEKKSSINDVHKLIQKDLVELYKTLNDKLGEDNPFARFNIGGGFYVWSDSRYQWEQMISTSSLEQSVVRSALSETKERVAKKLGVKTAEALFTVPDDGYIYYYDDGNVVRVLITGWGFKKPVRVAGKVDVDDIEKDNPVNISFLYDGKALENYEFGIQLPKMVKHFRTEPDGVYRFDNLKVNEKFKIIDFVTKREFLLTVIEGQSQYNYDVTQTARTDIYARMDSAPLSGENVKVAYNSKLYELTTGQDGHVSLDLPYYDGENISAGMRDKIHNEVVNISGNQIYFDFESPKEIVETYIEVLVRIDGAPVLDRDVTVNYADRIYNGRTDSGGIFRCKVELEEGEICSVDVPEFDSQSKKLERSVNRFVFEKTNETPPPPPEDDPVVFDPHILIEGDKGFIGSKYPVTVTYCGKDTQYVSDENGIVPLHGMMEGQIMKVTDGLNPENVCEYKLDSNQLEYIFHVPYEPQSTDKDIKVTILDVDGNPIKCDRVRFQQDATSSEILATLDAEGSTYFSKDTFGVNKDIKVTILGSESQYDPIIFTLDEDECEYVLQERGAKSPWWMILLQILAVLATIAGALVLWPFIEGFIMGMFNVIYN